MSTSYHSYFDTVSSTRKSPAKRATTANQQSPPKKLSRSFTRQLEKTLSNTSTKKRKGGVRKSQNQAATKHKRRSTGLRMPKRPAAEETYDSDGGFVEDAEPKSKKSKSSASKGSKRNTALSNGALPAMEKDKDGVFWPMSGKRRLQLTEFKGTLMVGIREFYEKDGQILPGKKGIAMNLEQFDTVLGLLPELQREIEKKGGKVRSVKVDKADAEGVEAAAEETPDEEPREEHNGEKREEGATSPKPKGRLDKFKHKAMNHEATSDENED